MEFNKEDQIKYFNDYIQHESAGGFVFFEKPDTHKLLVALLQKDDGAYVIPKGHIKKGEKASEAAIREISEELSLKNDTINMVSFLGIDKYTFTLEENIIHRKSVHLYVFEINKKLDIEPASDEGFKSAKWFPFDEATKKISFDKENLLRARQIFYYNKPVKNYNNLLDISSLTIAMPTYNGARTIYNTLQSVVERLKELPSTIYKEIIICTDHCADNTNNIVKSFIKKMKLEGIKIKLVSNSKSQGKSIALNEIFKLSSGELFFVIDDDILLRNKCLIHLLKALIKRKNIRCFFSSWERLPLRISNPWRIFWHWVLGVKFDIQPYDKPSEIMRGACMMLRRENFVYFPPILNEDQFLQYIYWPRTEEIKGSVIYFNSVSSIFDYYRRFVRIMAGYRQISNHFARERFDECSQSLFRKVDYRKIMRLPWKLKGPFLFYRFIRFFINIYVKIKIRFIKSYEWFRFKQN